MGESCTGGRDGRGQRQGRRAGAGRQALRGRGGEHGHSTKRRASLTLERQLQLGACDDDVGEVQQMHLQWVQHALARHDHALGLLLYRQ